MTGTIILSEIMGKSENLRLIEWVEGMEKAGYKNLAKAQEAKEKGLFDKAKKLFEKARKDFKIASDLYVSIPSEGFLDSEDVG